MARAPDEHSARSCPATVTAMLALTTDSVKNLGLGAIVGVVVLGVLAVVLVQKAIARVISLALTALLVLGLYNQRASISDCVNKLKTNAGGVVNGRVKDPTCKFFGVKIKVPLDKLQPTTTK